MLSYSNPRMHATIENWPSGGERVTARFAIEIDPKRGERATRLTKIGGAPTKLTYAAKARIVDGDDGRTYIAQLPPYGYRHISIMRGDMKFQEEVVSDTDPRYGTLLSLFA